jgi:acetyltransferase-like isoleucine patch superfamily enzyme
MKFNGRNIFISPKAKLGSNVRVGDNAIIYDGVEIGDDSTICNNVVLGEPLAQYFKDPDYVNPVTIVGAGALIRSHTIIYAGCILGSAFTTGHRACIREHTHIGDHCMVGTLCDIQGYVQMGNYCRLHSYVQIAQTSVLGDFVFLYPFVVMTDDPYPPSNDTSGGRIDNYSQVAVHSVILPGVHIGENCFVGANSVVSRSVPPFSMALGNPARRVMDVRKYGARGKEHLYPWMTRFDRGMPWAGIGFDAWSALQHTEAHPSQEFDADPECNADNVNQSRIPV